MVNCAAIGCTNRSNDKPELSFHKILSKRDEDRRKKWLQNIRREGVLPKDESFRICSEHFEDKCFKRDLQVKSPLSKIHGLYIICSLLVNTV